MMQKQEYEKIVSNQPFIIQTHDLVLVTF